MTKRNAASVAVAYMRVSTEEQQLGPEAQRAAIETWAVQHSLTVASWHVDQGLSGSLEMDDRPALIEALASLRDARAGVLLVAKRDRLARDVYVAGAIERAVSKLGARVVSADGTGNGDTPADAFMRTILDGAAEYERALIRARTKHGLAVKIKRQEVAGSVPLGFRAVPCTDGRTTKHGRPLRTLEPDPVEQAMLAEARALARTGTLSLRGIAAMLNERGYRSRTGTPLGPVQVTRMLASN